VTDSRRACGHEGSSGTKLPPASNVATIPTTISALRGREIPTL